MKVRCISNTGESLRSFENRSLKNEEFGRFGSTRYSEFGELEIGKEYLVMGMLLFESYLAYLVDDYGLISACPSQLFEVIDDELRSNWHFRLIQKHEDIFPYLQAIWGYNELCLDKKAYEKLIVEQDREAIKSYFNRKKELTEDLS